MAKRDAVRTFSAENNEARANDLDAIADAIHESKKADFVDVGEPEPVVEPEAEPQAEAAPAEVEPVQEVAPAIDENVPVTRKVNGKEITKPLGEWLRAASKVEAADDYLGQAAEVFRSTQNTAPQPSVPDVDEDLALARAIQLGSEKEAVEAIRRIKSRPSVTTDDVTRTVDERITFTQAAQKAQEEFKEIFSDPNLRLMFLQKDANLLQTGDKRPYLERYRSIGEEIRGWTKTLIGPATLEQKEQRKASVAPVPSASAKAVPPADNDEPETVQDTIRQMAKARGQSWVSDK